MNYRTSIIEFVYLYHVTKSKKSLCLLFSSRDDIVNQTKKYSKLK